MSGSLLVAVLVIASEACTDFRGTDIPCDELQRAREFNDMLNSGSPATQSRSYKWVRRQMNDLLLPRSRWQVGHMCQNQKGTPLNGKGAGPEDKALNLLAQTMKDNRGSDGLLDRQMSRKEAKFYSRTLTTCDDLHYIEKKEL